MAIEEIEGGREGGREGKRRAGGQPEPVAHTDILAHHRSRTDE